MNKTTGLWIAIIALAVILIIWIVVSSNKTQVQQPPVVQTNTGDQYGVGTAVSALAALFTTWYANSQKQTA